MTRARAAHRIQNRCLLCVIALVVALLPRVALGDALHDRLAEAVQSSHLGENVSISVVDAVSGQDRFSHRAEVPLNPASNMKLITAAAALLELGSDFSIRSGFYGTRNECGALGTLYARGFGDPSLRFADLLEMAEQLAADGAIREVGDIVVDGSYFDDQVLPPAFDQQPNEIAPFRAAVAALAIDESAYLLRVLPGPAAGSPAIVRLTAPGYFDIDNQLVTQAEGPANVVAIEQERGGRSVLRLRGTIPLGVGRLSYSRRVAQPLLYAGYAISAALRATGIRVRGAVRVGRAPTDAPLVAMHTSRPLGELLPALGKASSNFAAEMLLKVLGAERVGLPGTSAHGLDVLARVMTGCGVPAGVATLVNGSGLFQGNRVAANHFTALLRCAYGNAAIRDAYIGQLAIAGVDGTLHNRLRDLPAPRIVRAKTGTLASVSALSGYVLGPTPDRVIAFSVVANNVSGRLGTARTLADQVVRQIAAELYASAH